MINCEQKIVGNILTLTIDLSKSFGKSASGKSITIASSEGNQKLDDPRFESVRLGLNVYSAVPKTV